MARAASAVIEVVDDAVEDAPVLHASIYEELRRRLITGKIVPGVGLSTRGLAAELGVSQMPVRDALSRNSVNRTKGGRLFVSIASVGSLAGAVAASIFPARSSLEVNARPRIPWPAARRKTGAGAKPRRN